MIREIRKHVRAYLVLFTLLATFIVGFILAWPNVMLQRSFVLFLGAAYFSWGVVHHHKSGVISVKVVLEYFFVSLLACSLLFVLTL